MEARQALGERVDPGIERVFGRPDDYTELGKDGYLRIETVSGFFGAPFIPMADN